MFPIFLPLSRKTHKILCILLVVLLCELLLFVLRYVRRINTALIHCETQLWVVAKLMGTKSRLGIKIVRPKLDL